jgi:hypothetical protein
MQANKAVAICALALSSTFGSATAGYATNSNGVLIIGQDTKTAVPQLNWTGNSCKMFVSDKYALATSGTASSLNVERLPNGKSSISETHEIDPVFNSIMRKGGTPRQVVASLMQAIKDLKRSQWRQANLGTRKIYMSSVKELGGTLLWFDGITPMLNSFSVTALYKGGTITFATDKNPGPMKFPDSTAALEDMFHKATKDKRFMAATLAIADPIERVRKLLEEEARVSSDFVGPPFTIFRLSPMGGSSWILGAETCAANTSISAKH